MGGSRSTSIEGDADNDADVNHPQTTTQPELRTLLPPPGQDHGLDLAVGYSNPIEVSPESCRIPSSPPPSYEFVLKEQVSEKKNQCQDHLDNASHHNYSCTSYVPFVKEEDEDEDDDDDDEEEDYDADESDALDNTPGKGEIAEGAQFSKKDLSLTEPDNAAQLHPKEDPKVPRIIQHKSSKQLYKAVAKQWGITCKMSDQCRCLDCQSHYFDCDYDQNENDKTDGGLGAGTPMFISEVMHGSGCTIL